MRVQGTGFGTSERGLLAFWSVLSDHSVSRHCADQAQGSLSVHCKDLPEDPNFDPAPGILLTAFVTEPFRVQSRCAGRLQAL